MRTIEGRTLLITVWSVGVGVGVGSGVEVGVGVGAGSSVGVAVGVGVGMAAMVASTRSVMSDFMSTVGVGVRVGNSVASTERTVAGMSGVGPGVGVALQAAMRRGSRARGKRRIGGV